MTAAAPLVLEPTEFRKLCDAVGVGIACLVFCAPDDQTLIEQRRRLQELVAVLADARLRFRNRRLSERHYDLLRRSSVALADSFIRMGRTRETPAPLHIENHAQEAQCAT